MTGRALRGPYAKSADVRRRIVEACAEAFRETGFRGATMKDIAQRAGISHTGLLHHYARKEDLLAAVLKLRVDQSTEYLRSAQALDPGDHPLGSLRGMLDVLAEDQQRPGLVELHCTLSAEASSPDHPAHPYYAERSRAARSFYRTAFTALAERGQLQSSIDPENLATMTVSLYHGLQSQWLLDRASVDIAAALRGFFCLLVPELDR
jgi:AcrR family transcriptional regulator